MKLHKEHPITAWRARGYTAEQIIEGLFIQILTRQPSKMERQWAAEFVGLGRDDKAWEDLQWALLNTREFQFIR